MSRPIRTFLDSGVLISFHKKIPDDLSAAAGRVLLAPNREFVTSRFVQLEVEPKARFVGHQRELKMLGRFFAQTEHVALGADELLTRGMVVASREGVNGLDAVHVAAAIAAGCAELITAEKSTRSIYRARGVRIVDLRTLA